MDLKKVKENSRALAKVEITRARETLKGEDLQLFNLLFKTGLRIGEIKAYVDNYDQTPGFVCINPQKKNRMRVLPKFSIDKLKDCACGRDALMKRIQRWNLNFSAHDLRATFITRLYHRGVDGFIIQRIVGHKRISSTIAYLQINTEDNLWVYDLLETEIGDPENIAAARKIIDQQRIELVKMREYIRKLKEDKNA